MPALMDLVDKAATDPDFLARLQKDPFATAEAEGLSVSDDEVRVLLGMADATHEQLVEGLQERLSYSVGADFGGKRGM